MPANLTPQYKKAEESYRTAKTSEDKLKALYEMLATVPKHKGTEKIQADIKKRIKKLKEEEKKEKGGKRKDIYFVEKEGAGQIVIIGAPNSGKSSLISFLTKAKSEVADYPHTTRKTIPGMMEYENIKIQLVDTPAFGAEYMESWIIQIIRNADLVWLVVDSSGSDALERIDFIINKLRESKINLCKSPPLDYHPGHDPVYIKAIILAHKFDTESAKENYKVLEEIYKDQFEIIATSTVSGANLERLKDLTYKTLEIIRVYTKIPGRSIDRSEPFVLKTGTSLIDAAEQVHKDFAHNLKYARIWSKEKYEGQRVERSYILQEEDIVEFHIK